MCFKLVAKCYHISCRLPPNGYIYNHLNNGYYDLYRSNSSDGKCNSSILYCLQHVIVIGRKLSNSNLLHCNVIDPRPVSGTTFKMESCVYIT